MEGERSSPSSALFPVYFEPKRKEAREAVAAPTRHIRLRWKQGKETKHVVGDLARQKALELFTHELGDPNCVEYVHVQGNKPSLFATFQTIEEAQHIVNKFDCQHVPPFCGPGKIAMCSFVTAKYATSVEAAKSNLEDTQESVSVQVPGLYIDEDFITPEEEQQLLDEINSFTWDTSLSSRRVQHYGLKFDYVRRAVDLDDTATPPLTDLMQKIASRIQEKGYSPHEFNQVTINEYEPGAGISPHVDTKEVFDECIASLTLQSHAVMEFRRKLPDENRNEVRTSYNKAREKSLETAFQAARLGVPGSRIHSATSSDPSGSGVGTAASTGSNVDNSKSQTTDCSVTTSQKGHNEEAPTFKQQVLNCRSLVVMTGDSRYYWNHGIPARKSDLINGVLYHRGTRISLTFRKVIQKSNDESYTPDKLFSPALRTELSTHDGSEFPVENGEEQTPDIETEHVHKLYDAIAPHFSHTRHSGWPSVTKLVEEQSPGTLVADVGCGNGKYLGLNPSIACVGSDKSVGLTAICGERGFDVFTSDCLKVPWRSGTADLSLCIAVMHHLSTLCRRKQCISELARITRPGGKIMIQAWAFEQSPKSRHQFEEQDVMVPWKLDRKLVSVSEEELKNSHAQVDEKRGTIVFQRYCHVYREGEIEGLIRELGTLEIDSSWWEKGNWCIISHKSRVS